MRAMARRDSGRPVSAHPKAATSSREGRHDPGRLAYELAAAGFRPKLKVNQPGDEYEQEADEIADRVMRSPAGDASGSPGGECCSGCASGAGCSGGVQPQAASAGSPAYGPELSSATESQIRSGGSAGQSLPGPTRAFFEPRLGRDLGDVRVHTGPDAAQLSDSVQAHAFTHGSHVWLGSGLSPGPSHVLAHELAHVVQQAGPAVARPSRSSDASGVSIQRQPRNPHLLQRDTGKTVTQVLHPEETGLFTGSVPIPPSKDALLYRVELYNVSPLFLSEQYRPKLGWEVAAGVRAALEELRRSGPLPSGLPTLSLRLDAGYSRVMTAGYLESKVREAASGQMKRLVAHSREVAVNVVEAIVHMLDSEGGRGGEPENSPRYATEVTRTVQEPDHVALVWEWWRLTVEVASDAEGVTGASARRRIAAAAAKTAPLVAIVKEDKKGRPWADRYEVGREELTQWAAREEVDKMIAAGVSAEIILSTSRPEAGGTEDERIRSGAASTLSMLGELGELAHRLTEHPTEKLAEHAKEAYEEQLRKYIHKVFTEHDLGAEAPLEVRHARFGQGLALLKGGLDAVNAIMAVADPEARKEMFKARSSYFGTVVQGVEMNELLWKFVSGAITFTGAAVSGLAWLAGKTALAEGVLDATVKGIGAVTGPLFLVGIIRGALVFLDPDASPDAKVEAAVTVASSAVGLAGWLATHRVPWVAPHGIKSLAGVADWSGPIAISLAINLELVKYEARLLHGAKVGVARWPWATCHIAMQAASVKVEDWMRRLAVTLAILARETEPYRRMALSNYAATYRGELVDRQLRPFIEARLSSKSMHDDAASCGPALTRRLKPMQALLPTAGVSDDAALAAAAVFITIVHKAFAEWDEIVMEEEPTHVGEKVP
jgi:hypothetical protein